MFGIFSFIGWLIIGAIICWIAGKVWVGHGYTPSQVGLIYLIIPAIMVIGSPLTGWI